MQHIYLLIFSTATKVTFCLSQPFPPLPYFKPFSLSGTQDMAPWSLCSGTKITCHANGHTDLTEGIKTRERGSRRLHSRHFNRTTCTFTPRHSLKLPQHGCGCWLDFSINTFWKVRKNFLKPISFEFSVNFYLCLHVVQEKVHPVLQNVNKVRVQENRLLLLKIPNGSHGFWLFISGFNFARCDALSETKGSLPRVSRLTSMFFYLLLSVSPLLSYLCRGCQLEGSFSVPSTKNSKTFSS